MFIFQGISFTIVSIIQDIVDFKKLCQHFYLKSVQDFHLTMGIYSVFSVPDPRGPRHMECWENQDTVLIKPFIIHFHETK